jgi:hypothetical protein
MKQHGCLFIVYALFVLHAHVPATGIRCRYFRTSVSGCLCTAQERAQFQAGHIPCAVSMPLDELDRRLDELPADMPIVAYCRGPCCVMADQALELIARRGLRA